MITDRSKLGYKKTINNDTISLARKKWLSEVDSEIESNRQAEIIANKIINNEITVDSLFPQLNKKIFMRAVFRAIEVNILENHEFAISIYQKLKSTIQNLYINGNSDLEDEIVHGMNKLFNIGFISKKDLLDLEIPIINLLNPDLNTVENHTLMKISEKINNNEKIKDFFYPFFLVFGSRIKGYSNFDGDVDLAMMIKPNVKLEDRNIIFKLLYEEIPELKGYDKILEFWTQEKNGSISLKMHDSNIETMVGPLQIHFILGSAFIGMNQSSKVLFSILDNYLDLSRFDRQEDDVRAHFMRQLELDSLQCRLMHKGYRRFNFLSNRPDIKNGDLIDWDSDFWDQGYRKLATLLYLSKVFLPKIK